MIRRRHLPHLFPLLLAAFLLAACGGGAAQESAGDPPTKTPPAPPTVPALEETAPEAYPAQSEQSAAPEQAQEAGAAYPPPAPTSAPVSYPAEETAGEGSGPRTFVVVPGESTASYLVDEEFLQDALSKLGIEAGEVVVEGTTDNVSGQVSIDPADTASPLGETRFTADLTRLRTDQDRRDRWLQQDQGGPQFSLFPQATFVATGIEGLPPTVPDGQEVQFQLSGDLTVRETTAPVTFDVTAVVEGDTLRGTAETRLLLTDLGIEPPDFARTLTVANEFGIRVDLVAREE